MTIPLINRFFHRSDPGHVWDLVARSAIVLIGLLIPVLVLPATGDIWELHKTMLLFILVGLAWVGYLGGFLARRQTTWDWNYGDWIVLSLVLITGLSTALSVDSWQSWAGLPGSYSETMTVTLALASVYFISSRIFIEAKTRWLAWSGLAFGLSGAVLLQVFQLSNFSLLPASISSSPIINVVSNNGLDIAVLAAVVVTAAMLWLHRAKESWSRGMLMAVVVMSLIVMTAFSQAIAWGVLAVGMIAVVLMESRQGNVANTRRIMAAVLIAALGLLIQLTNLASHTAVPRPIDLRLDQPTSQAIAGTTLKRLPLLGSGPSTWYDDFVSRRPVSYNQTTLWATRFIKARTAWTELLGTVGVLGTAVWAVMIGWWMWWLWRRWQEHPDLEIMLGLVVIGLTALTGFFMTWSLVWMVVFWLTLGFMRAAALRPAARPMGAGLPVGLVVTGLAIVGLWVMAGRVYGSEILVSRANTKINQTGTLSQIEHELAQAIQWNPGNISAAALLAQTYATEAELQIQANHPDQVKILVPKAANTMQILINHRPKDPAAYEAYNNLLNRLSPYTGDAVQRANHNFSTLQKLEPTNPVHDVGYGQTLMALRTSLISQSNLTDEQKKLAEQYVQLALKAYDAALRKKPQYLQAIIAKAQALAVTEKYDQALATLQTAGDDAQGVSTYWQEVGLVQGKLNHSPEAVAAFDQALKLDPTNVSIYLTYSQFWQDHKDTAKAKEILNQGLAIIPDEPNLTAALKAL